ncbi:MAG: ATP-binding protein [archaeon]
MILGRITGKVTTTDFSFVVDGAAKKFDFVQVFHPEHEYVLGQIVELERDSDKTIAKCLVLGHRDDRGSLRPIRTPLEPGIEVLKPEDSLLRDVIDIGGKHGAFIGTLEAAGIRVNVDLNRLLTGHISVLAKSGSGKSYTLGVLLEEVIEHRIPVLILDPHGEYSSLAEPNTDKDQVADLAKLGLKPKGYAKHIMEYGDPDIVPGANPLLLSNMVSMQEMIQLFPGKLSAMQQSMLHGTFMGGDRHSFEEIILALEEENSPHKWGIINGIKSLRNSGLFSSHPTAPQDLIAPGRCTIINLKGIDPHFQDIILLTLSGQLFEERKREKVPPFLLVLEEAHNFVPERGFGDAKSTATIRTLVREGRKFGLGVAVVTQRPALVQKTVLSQCTTQIILKMTNANDLRAVTMSVEGITSEAESEIRNLPIGTALLTGITDVPLFVRVRPRRSKHGGDAVRLVGEENEEAAPSFQERQQEFSEKEVLNVLEPQVSEDDLRLMSETPIASFRSVLVPVAAYRIKSGKGESGYLLVDLAEGKLITDADTGERKHIPDLESLSTSQVKALKAVFSAKGGLVPDAAIAADIEALRATGLIKESGGVYHLHPGFVFSRLSKFATFAKPQHKEIAYDEKKEATHAHSSFLPLLSQSGDVEFSHRCYLLTREPVSESRKTI